MTKEASLASEGGYDNLPVDSIIALVASKFPDIFLQEIYVFETG